MAIYSDDDQEHKAELLVHKGHKIRVQDYGTFAGATIECLECHEVLVEFGMEE